MTTSIQKDALLSQFSVLAYKDSDFLSNSANLPADWTLAHFIVEPPFAAFAFRNSTTGEVIVAYRGTDGPGDLPADSNILAGRWDSQFQKGMDFLANVRSRTDLVPNSSDTSKLLVTGHSLGGAIAQVVAYAYGLDGSTIDPGAAQRIVGTEEFRAAALAAGLQENNWGAPDSFTNRLVGGSMVSGSTGPHIGSTSFIPSLGFSGEQALTAFLIGMANPLAGFGYLIATDQFSNKHSADQISQALQLMAGTVDPSVVGTNNLILTQKVTEVRDPVTGEVQLNYSQTEFEVRNKAGDLQSTVRFSGRGEERQIEVFDSAGELKSTTTLSPSGPVTVRPVRGDSIVITYLPESQTNLDGTVTTIYRTPDGSIASTSTTIIYDDGSAIKTMNYADGRVIRTATDINGTITSYASIQNFDDGSYIETVQYSNGKKVQLVYDSDGNLSSQQEIESGGHTLQKVIGQYGGTVIDALSLIRAIQTGEPLPVVASGLRLANDLSSLSGSQNLNLSGAANVASGVLSLMGLEAALERGDTMGAITAGAQAVSFGATSYANLMGASGTESSSAVVKYFGEDTAFANLEGALPYLNLINSIAHGDMTGAAVAVVDLVMIKAVGAYTIPVLGWAYAVYNIIDSLFGGDDIPDPWGNGRFVWNGTGISIESAGETGGNEAVQNVLNTTIATMNSLVERVRQQNPGSQLGIIPNRMPSLSYGMDGYHYTDIDPLTGVEKHPALRFDTNGRPYNAEPGSPESYQSLIEGVVRSALARGAIAPLWEVQTAKMQTDAGDPKAGLTEEERAGRDGQLAAPIAGSTQTFRPVALDLDGDGIETVGKADGVAFDVDDSGYLKQTGWLKSDDAFLMLDRDYNGQVDSGKELFSNGTVALSRRGLAGMAWVDANYDGRLTAADPVWNELKVWRDADADGVQDDGETQGLSAMGVTELNYAMGTFQQNGQTKQLASPNLEADKDGSRISVVPEGILVQSSSDGKLSLLVSRIDDKTVVEANRDGVTSYEDVETIISGADLLANDTLGGFTGRDLTITGLTNFRHGTGWMDVNGFVHFTPEANYAGSDAGFDYVVRASNGQEGQGKVDITLQNVNDAPTLGNVTHGTRPIYGYEPIFSDEFGNYLGGGNAIYQPYTTTTANEWGWETTVQHNTPIAYEDTGAGKVIGLDIDDPVSSLTYEIVNQPQYGSVSLDAYGNFQYISWKEPGVASDRIVIDGQYAGTKDGTVYTQWNLPPSAVYPTTDVFQVRITDPNGASTIQSISVPHYGPYLPPTPPGGGGKKPIAVDLGGNGFEFVNVNDSNVFFDINGDGWKRRTSWIGKDDGLLAYDIDGDGKIDKVGEISFARYMEGAQSDLEGLAAFDSNGNGRFDTGDEKWAKFGIWQDANQDGITDAGEFHTLDEMGISAVELTSDGRFQVIDGQTVHGMGAMEMADGSQMAIADVTFAYSNEVQVPQAEGGSTVVPTSPFSPNGELLEGTEGKDLILGKNGNNIVNGYAGDDVILEDGGNDMIDAGDGNDLVYAGADNDIVLGGSGDDVIYAGLGSDVVFGGDGNDAVLAEGGNDVVFGGAGNDLLSGGWGNDVLSGDDGDDQVYGEGGNDALFGRDGNDELGGMDGYDLLDGGAGNDLLDGGTGADEMIGGTGDDIYVVDDHDDVVKELAGEGLDTVRTNLDGYVLGGTIENLILTDPVNPANPGSDTDLDNPRVARTASGNDLDNAITGNRANNVLYGGAGNDILNGGLGGDILFGGTGDDTYIVDNVNDITVENAGEGIDLVKAGVSYTLSANVENLVLTGDTAINGTGNELDNRLQGNRGNNLLDGGTGADEMAGGRGNDAYLVDNAGDAVVENAGEGIDTVFSSIDYVLPEHVENLTLLGNANLSATGNDLANLIVGNGADNLLFGGVGNDELYGQDGNDIYLINMGDGLDRIEDTAGTDTVRFGAGMSLDNVALRVREENNVYVAHVRVLNAGGCEQADQGFDFVVTRDESGKYISPIEHFQFADGSVKAFDDLLIKTRITYAFDQETVTGRDDDIIYAGPHSDTIRAGSGHDVVYTGAGGDTAYGEGGDDLLFGGIGNDSLNGGCGTDILIGSNGWDVLRDAGGNNAFYGGHQDDRIEAGNGNDFIAGGKHDDIIAAGGGANVIAFNRGDGRDTVLPGDNASNTLSLGDGIKKSDLAFSRSGQDLILWAGHGDSITFKDWYESEANRNFETLQIIGDRWERDGWDKPYIKQIEAFDFRALVDRFDAAKSNKHYDEQHMTGWALANGMSSARLGHSADFAWGGDLAASYAKEGGMAMTPEAVRDVLRDSRFGTQAQQVSRYDYAWPQEVDYLPDWERLFERHRRDFVDNPLSGNMGAHGRNSNGITSFEKELSDRVSREEKEIHQAEEKILARLEANLDKAKAGSFDMPANAPTSPSQDVERNDAGSSRGEHQRRSSGAQANANPYSPGRVAESAVSAWALMNDRLDAHLGRNGIAELGGGAAIGAMDERSLVMAATLSEVQTLRVARFEKQTWHTDNRHNSAHDYRIG